ncbi:MAG: PHP domain-containing protein [Solirubrobacterales bacterium]
MKIYTDFHIHTALSPCGDNDMTPNNIVNMSKIKGLDVIAITDHNSCENVPACIEAGKEIDLLVIPGMELQTREDVHVVCLFPDLESAMEFQELVYSKLPPLKNNENLFGEQLVFDKEDNVVSHNERLLLTASDLTLNDAFQKINELNGAFIPAHIDRDNFGIIYTLGFIPENLTMSTLEYSSKDKLKKLLACGMVGNNYKFIHSSDAHYLENILEQENEMEIDELKVRNIINKLK